MRLEKILSYAPSCLLALLTLSAPALVSAQAQPSQIGQWATLTQLPFFPVHNHLLPNGKVMIWPGDGPSGNDPRQWDPADQSLTSLAKPGYDLFCSGHAFLADGRLFVAGGHIASDTGFPKGAIYDWQTNTWANTPDMNAGRWYPTVTTLANGDMLVVSGEIDSTVGVNQTPQVYQAATNTWRSLTSAALSQPLYPQMFLAPNGKVVNVGASSTTRYLDTSGTGAWTVLANRSPVWRDYAAAVMYADGKILMAGGGDPPNNSAEVIDLNQAAPTWRQVAPMAVARRQTNATVLPDGNVLVTGGTSGSGFNDATHAVFSAELWNPATETWTTMASSAGIPRIYHSAAILLPDGRVMTTGGNGQSTPEVFSPPYLFKGVARPAMSGMPPTFGYGQHFSVQTPDAADITKVTLIRITSVTHSFNENQRLNVLSFTPGAGTLDITAPGNANIAPPGHYLLFLVNSSGVPSIGSIVQLGASGAPPPPVPAPATLTSLSPNSASAGGPAFTLNVNGTDFLSGATVRWNGANRTTTFVSSTQLSAAVPATDIATAGTVQVTALNPGASVSNALPFTITGAPTGPVPAKLTSLSPSSASAGGPAFTLNVNGTDFLSGATVRWNGANRTTTFVSSTQLSAAIPATDIATAGTVQVTVLNPGASVSNALPFTITGTTTTRYTLTVTKGGSGSQKGVVTSSPAGVSCGTTCSSAFNSGTVVTLTAQAGANEVFSGWSGACSGTGSCTVTMNANKSVMAKFSRR
jgi:hypothetical protein